MRNETSWMARALTAVLLAAGPWHRVHGAEPCGAATVWTAPRVLHYRTVVRDAEEPGRQPDFTVFIEPADGSAGEIDPASATLNGLAALDGPAAVGDADGNGIPDAMVKFDRGALVTTDGPIRVAARTASGACVAGETVVEVLCRPSGVEHSDHFIEFTTSGMPDEKLDGLTARLQVRRVKPAWPPGCQDMIPRRALVLVHGRTVPGSAIFDLPHGDYSLMEHLAMRGIDTFAADHLGFGSSRIVDDAFDPMLDACNASLRECTLAGQVCAPAPGEVPGVNCDCQGLPRAQRMDQQGSPRHLNPSPLAARCAHKSPRNFQWVTDQVEQVRLVVGDALARTGLVKVHLLGYSFGGPVVGKYLGDDPRRQSEVAGVVFLASTFGGTQTKAQSATTFPLAVIDQDDQRSGFDLLPGPACPPRVAPDVPDALWAAMQAVDAVGPGWGPQPGGLSRYPIVPRFDWNSAVAQRIAVPALVMNGLRDNLVRVAASPEI